MFRQNVCQFKKLMLLCIHYFHFNKIMRQSDMDEFAKSLIEKSPYEIYKAIRDFDKKNGKGSAFAALSQNDEFSAFCSQQLSAFLNNCLALTKRDAENIDKWWKFSNNNFSLEDIQKADAKAAKGLFIRAERFLNMDTNPTFLKFVKNIPDIQDEMNMPQVAETIRLNQRQKIVDFVLFMKSGKKSSELINNDSWEILIKEFNLFPKINIRSLTNLHSEIVKYNTENPHQRRSEKEALLMRLLSYRLDNICKDIWIPQIDEILFLENYLKDEKFNSSELVQKTLTKLLLLKEHAENEQQKASAPKPVATVINFIQNSDDESTENENSQEQKNNISSEKPSEVKVVADNKETSQKDSVKSSKKETAPSLDTWADKTLSNWENWAQKNNKIVQKYNSSEPALLALKIFDTSDNINNDKFEAKIVYKSAHDIVLSGKDNKIPSDEVFAAIVAQAKKNGPEICFGDIKSDEFKARLMLACLNDPDIVMVNPPKFRDLIDIPSSLRHMLADKILTTSKKDASTKNSKNLNKENNNINKPPSKKENDKSEQIFRAMQMRKGKTH